ncbi:hypothetical protein D2A34_12230 [Clostridium chromiireducens]|uniref:Carbohydrate-binding module family 96 domain-containing protein n=1 Tax=Clostridium chromiireducens TaxID=225345 RepID=A0A399INS4_9CLOT|nr:DNRLRE domain-containing protein [Clostridium chromiireducens]RII33949.1 hypothetical protein D2A34_12230 [Clostridium chromiireducens]
MRSIIIPAIKSLTVTNKYPDKSLNENVITVGYDGKNKYYSYLFFDISSIPCNAIISNAELVLFKADKFYNDNSKKISISPLRDYFSSYTTYNNSPDYDHYTVINFYPLTSKISVTINITTIISSWVKNKPNSKNKGIMLYGKNRDVIISFGSAKSDDNYLIPFIIANYEHSHPNKPSKCEYHLYDKCPKEDCNKKCSRKCKEEFEAIIIKICKEICKNNCNPQPIPTFEQVRVTGTVAPLSIYYIIVELVITRVGSGHEDSYYVTDEYDNSLNNNSIYIDKTYDIAVIPSVQPGDTGNVNLYGSYKGPLSIL